jgi:hypothetical protein
MYAPMINIDGSSGRKLAAEELLELISRLEVGRFSENFASLVIQTYATAVSTSTSNVSISNSTFVGEQKFDLETEEDSDEYDYETE